jgi:hypothetical protein
MTLALRNGWLSLATATVELASASPALTAPLPARKLKAALAFLHTILEWKSGALVVIGEERKEEAH